MNSGKKPLLDPVGNFRTTGFCEGRRRRPPLDLPGHCLRGPHGDARSEVLQVRVHDIDFKGPERALVKEKKKRKDKRTYRRVPLTPFLAEAIRAWLTLHPGGQFFVLPRGRGAALQEAAQEPRGIRAKGCGQLGSKISRKPSASQGPVAAGPLTKNELYRHFKQTLAGSKWEVLRGWHDAAAQLH